MNEEKGFSRQEKTLEKFPSKEEIKSTLETILKGQRYKELRIKSNENGVYLYEVEIALKNGEKIEYLFQKATNNYRDKSLDPFARFSASIHMTNYNKDGMPYHGSCIANYLDGVWSIYC